MKRLIIISTFVTLTCACMLLFFSCSTLKREQRQYNRQLKKSERQADKGGFQECYDIVDLYTCHEPYTRPTKEQQIKLIKYCKKGIELDTVSGANYDDMTLAFFYSHLADYTLDIKEKYSYYRKAAKLNDADSQWITGLYYLDGIGGANIDGRGGQIKNDSALYWIKQAYNNGNTQATHFLGNIYLTGKYMYTDIVKADTSVAIYYYKKACILGDSRMGSCDSVVSYYKRNKNLKDTTDLSIYSELVKRRSQFKGYK